MEPTKSAPHNPFPGSHALPTLLKIALCFGILTGVLEALLQLAVQQIRWQRLDSLRPVSMDILWMAPLWDALFFLLLGSLVLAAARFLGKAFPWIQVVRLYATVTALILLFSVGVVHTAVALFFSLSVWITLGRRIQQGKVLRWRPDLFLGASAVLVCLAFVTVQLGSCYRERLQAQNLPPAPPGLSNVLLLVVDNLRADHVGAYGYTRPTTPTLDSLARHGVLFETAISTSSWTLPAHCSLLTGLLPSQHGAHRSPCDFPGPRLPEVLNSLGYVTGGFSGNNLMFGRRQGFAAGFLHFDDYFHSWLDGALRTALGKRFESAVLRRLGVRQIPARRTAAGVNQALLRWIAQQEGRPFFAVVNYFDLHDPFIPPRPYQSYFTQGRTLPAKINTFFARYYPELSAEELQAEVAGYDGALRYVDDQLALLLDALAGQGKLNNTLVVITSDHGESFGERGLLHHGGSLYAEQIHVPLIMHFPQRVPAGKRIAGPVSIASIPATLLEQLGRRHDFQGPSLAPFLRADNTLSFSSTFAISELAPMPDLGIAKNPNYSGGLLSLVTPDWHLILHEKHGAELYRATPQLRDLENIAASPEGSVMVSDLRPHLERRAAAGFAK